MPWARRIVYHSDMSDVCVIGGGLAGCEAARRLSRSGLSVDLYEMKPIRFSPAHSSPLLAELVCSNSLRSADPMSAVGLLKEEMTRLDSLVMEAAMDSRVPAGKALAVDRERFARYITDRIESDPRVRIIREEVVSLDSERLTVLASGPLTSDALSQAIGELIGRDYLYFYDAIAPIVDAESIDMAKAFIASRYDEGPGDYINCPMDRAEYDAFLEALLAAEKTPLREFEKPRFFEGCLPIEVMAERGPQTLTFGPMKPVGLVDPRTGDRPYAVVQLRKENEAGTAYNLVGFQTRLKTPAQNVVFRKIPGLENAEFMRWGSVHRNTFLNGPALLTPQLQLKSHPNILAAGQLSGVEGYVESAAMGILAGINVDRLHRGRPPLQPPAETAMGALTTHLTNADVKRFQPSNVNFGLMPAAPKGVRKKERPAFYVERARNRFSAWLQEVNDDS